MKMSMPTTLIATLLALTAANAYAQTAADGPIASVDTFHTCRQDQNQPAYEKCVKAAKQSELARIQQSLNAEDATIRRVAEVAAMTNPPDLFPTLTLKEKLTTLQRKISEFKKKLELYNGTDTECLYSDTSLKQIVLILLKSKEAAITASLEEINKIDAAQCAKAARQSAEAAARSPELR